MDSDGTQSGGRPARPPDTRRDWPAAPEAAVQLANPVYAGLVRSEGKLIAATHEAILEPEVFEQVQELRTAKARTHGRGRPFAGQHLFPKGFPSCGLCGTSMVPRTEPTRSGGRRETYRCYGRHRDPDSCSLAPRRRRGSLRSASPASKATTPAVARPWRTGSSSRQNSNHSAAASAEVERLGARLGEVKTSDALGAFAPLRRLRLAPWHPRRAHVELIGKAWIEPLSARSKSTARSCDRCSCANRLNKRGKITPKPCSCSTRR